MRKEREFSLSHALYTAPLASVLPAVPLASTSVLAQAFNGLPSLIAAKLCTLAMMFSGWHISILRQAFNKDFAEAFAKLLELGVPFGEPTDVKAPGLQPNLGKN